MRSTNYQFIAKRVAQAAQGVGNGRLGHRQQIGCTGQILLRHDGVKKLAAGSNPGLKSSWFYY
jgi:hypothetical protein